MLTVDALLQAPGRVDEVSGVLGGHDLHVGALGQLGEELVQLDGGHAAAHTQQDVDPVKRQKMGFGPGYGSCRWQG